MDKMWKILDGENSGKTQESLGPCLGGGTFLPQRWEGRKRTGDNPGKFWGGLVGLGTGRKENIIQGKGPIYLVKLELKACRGGLQWLWNCNEESTIDEEKGLLVSLTLTGEGCVEAA